VDDKFKKEEKETYPNIEFNIFIRYCLDVKPDCGDCSNRLIEFEFIQYGCDLVFFLIIGKNIGEGRGMGGWTN
jgi:hypothetical protein